MFRKPDSQRYHLTSEMYDSRDVIKGNAMYKNSTTNNKQEFFSDRASHTHTPHMSCPPVRRRTATKAIPPQVRYVSLQRHSHSHDIYVTG